MKQISLIIIGLFTSVFTHAQIVPQFTVNDTIVCLNNTLQFTDLSKGDSIISWRWDFGDTTTSTLQNPTHIYADTGTYSVTLKVSDTAGNTREITKQRYILVLDTPVANFTIDTSRLQPNFYITFIGDSGSTYQYCHYSWYFQTDSLPDTIATVYHIYNSTGEKTVKMKVSRGGCNSSIDKTFTVSDLIKIPTVFTPNGDNINDVFKIITNGIDTYTFTVYNRWGEIVYTFTAKDISWDGRSSAGVALSTGTYYYMLSCKTTNYIKTGSIFLSH